MAHPRGLDVEPHRRRRGPLAGVGDQPLEERRADATPDVVSRAELEVRAAIQPVLDDVRRRHARDHERIASYFAELAAEARAPRRRVDPKAVEAKVAHLVAERDAKLRDLGVRFAVKVSSSLAALVVAEVPAAFLQVKLRRRKESREVVLRAPALAHALDQIACDGCAGATGHPAACDDRLHLLCEGCAPSAQGRLSCPACAARR